MNGIVQEWSITAGKCFYVGVELAKPTGDCDAPQMAALHCTGSFRKLGPSNQWSHNLYSTPFDEQGVSEAMVRVDGENLVVTSDRDVAYHILPVWSLSSVLAGQPNACSPQAQ